MRGKKSWIILKACSTIFTMTLLVTGAVAAPREKILHDFGNGSDGTLPSSALILDGSGNLYGTTYTGGTGSACNQNCGTVFELTPKAHGGWKETVLHSFGHGADGTNPYAGLVFDASGNLYGTTSGGGIFGAGTVFELTPKANGEWTERVLHNFNSRDGLTPYATLIFDSAGNLYGTTQLGGDGKDCFGYGCGTVFELTPKSDGDWTEKVLYTFHKNRGGWLLYDSLIFDPAGNLYGTTSVGGNVNGCQGDGCGTVFELTPKAGGVWKEKVLHRFNGQDGYGPNGLVFDASGNLYGTTYFGGRYYNGIPCLLGCGTAFVLMPKAETWNETVLRNFQENDRDGIAPHSSLIFDTAGNLYGTTQNGGLYNSGTVFELTPKADGNWKQKVLRSFNPNNGDGSLPVAAVVMDAAGNLYGTTEIGGPYDGGGGTAFEVIP
jgi:uncharacterized repeat protein (TIGR03803 family)